MTDQTEDKVEGLDAAGVEPTTEAPKKRGRKPGSKNKVKTAGKGQEEGTGRRIDSQHTMDIPRPGDTHRPRRVPMGSGRNLYVTERDLERIEAMNCEPFWAYDDGKGRLDRMAASGWAKYLNEKGQEVTSATGGGAATYFLMIKDKEFQKEDRALRSKRVNANMSEDAKLGENEYYPDDRKQAVSVDYA